MIASTPEPTVWNPEKHDSKRNPIFLGKKLGLQRYDRPKYPKFLELYELQLSQFWRPEEISLIEDRNQYERLDDTERFVFNSNLRWQTATDSVLSRSINEISSFITNEELEICCQAWSFFETIHSKSYTYVLSNLVKNPGEFFDSVLESAEINGRMNRTVQAFNGLFQPSSDPRQQIFDAVLNAQITESISFYASFACSYYFGYRGKMEGNAKEISMVARDEAAHVAITQNILKIFRDVEHEGFVQITEKSEDKVYEAYRAAVQVEEEWARFLFSKGSLLGLNEESLIGYVRWLADNRLRGLGYSKRLYNVKTNPLGGWLNRFTDQSKVQAAPQETEVSNYRIGGRDTNLVESDLGDLDL